MKGKQHKHKQKKSNIKLQGKTKEEASRLEHKQEKKTLEKKNEKAKNDYMARLEPATGEYKQ